MSLPPQEVSRRLEVLRKRGEVERLQAVIRYERCQPLNLYRLFLRR